MYFGHFHHGQHFSIKNYRVVRFSTAVEFMFFRKLMVYIIKYINRFIIKSTLGGAQISFSIILHTKQWNEIHAISNRDSQNSSPVTTQFFCIIVFSGSESTRNFIYPVDSSVKKNIGALGGEPLFRFLTHFLLRIWWYSRKSEIQTF